MVEDHRRTASEPKTQTATALTFLLERSIVTTEVRRNYPTSIDVHLDATNEYHALRKGALGSRRRALTSLSAPSANAEVVLMAIEVTCDDVQA